MKTILRVVLSFILACSLLACSNSEAPTAKPLTSDKSMLIGLSMPTHSDESWIRHANATMDSLKAMGYTNFDVQWAEDVVESQVSQIENMITKDAKILVVAAVNGEALGEVLSKAKKAGIKVVAYDRLLMKTDAVDYYVTFDNYKVGVAQAEYIVSKLNLKDSTTPFNIELFGGSLDDSNSKYFYQGAYDILKPYLDSGKLIVKSKQISLETVATPGWEAAKAQSRMDNLLTAHYAGGSRVDAVLVPYDGLSIAVIASLKNTGYGTKSMPLPVVTGQDAEVASIQSIIQGEQTQTVWKDFRVQGKAAAQMLDEILQKKDVFVNDIKTYDNGVKVVPTVTNQVSSIDISNYKLLFDAGFYKKEDAIWKGLVK